MRVDDQGTVVAVVNKSDSAARVIHPRQAKKEITVDDLKTYPKEAKIQNEKRTEDREQLEAAVDTANKLMDLSSYHMKFKIDEESDRLQVTLIDNETQEVIREVPSKQMLEISARMKEVINNINKMVGVFVDEIG